MTYTRAVGMRVVKLLAEKKLTKYQLRKRAGLSKDTLESIMREQTRDVRLSTIDGIARGFEMTVQEFCNDSLFGEMLGGDK